MIKVKICGITNLDDAQFAIQSGASALGFIFAESPRKVSKEIVREIINKLETDISGQFPIFKVGVFVNEDINTIIEIANYYQLTHIQLHGNESPEYCEQLTFPIIKAFRLQDKLGTIAGNGFKPFPTNNLGTDEKRLSPNLVQEIKKYQTIYAFLLDTYQKGIYGGTGKQFDYSLIINLPRDKVFFLSGGLNPDNVVEAVQIANPDWVDISSGVEISPGKKDKLKIQKLFQNLKSANLISIP